MYEFSEFNPSTASDDLMDSFIELLDSLFFEINHEDSPIPKELQLKNLKDFPPHLENFWWIIHKKQKIVGMGQMQYHRSSSPSYEQNKHIAFAVVRLHAEVRGKGLGTQLLKKIVEKTVQNPNIVYIQSTTHWESGKKFSEKMGGILALETIENRLKISEVDWKLMQEWQEYGTEMAKKEGIQLTSFEKVPEEIIEKFCEFYTEVENQQPRGALEIQFKISPESRRLEEERKTKKGCEWYTLMTQEKNGEISGLTEAIFIPETPYRIDQELTGVKKEYRGRGLGKWLKAEMMFYIKENYPEVKYIRTGNANVNAPMLAINNQMGFKQFQKKTAYKFLLQDLEKLLSE